MNSGSLQVCCKKTEINGSAMLSDHWNQIRAKIFMEVSVLVFSTSFMQRADFVCLPYVKIGEWPSARRHKKPLKMPLSNAGDLNSEVQYGISS